MVRKIVAENPRVVNLKLSHAKLLRTTLKSINTIMSIIYLSLQATQSISIHSNWVEHVTNKLISLAVQTLLIFANDIYFVTD